jgi:hypothetical protein
VTPPGARHRGGMELGGLDEAVDGDPAMVAGGGARWRPSGHRLGKWRCKTGSPHHGAPQEAV